MGTCYGKRSACYDLTRNPRTVLICELKYSDTPSAALRRFSSLRQSVRSFSSLAYQHRSFRAKSMTIIKQSPENKHWFLIKYNPTNEALV